MYLNGQSMGATPYTHRDTKLVGSTTQVRIEMEGYETLNTSFSKDEQIDVGAAIAGCFVWVPFIWVMKYAPVHSYDLTPVSDKPQPGQKKPASTPQSKAEKLRELKQLLDEKIITQEEFDAEKKKILNGPE